MSARVQNELARRRTQAESLPLRKRRTDLKQHSARKLAKLRKKEERRASRAAEQEAAA